jgi:putative heme-binding domain-containing protein
MRILSWEERCWMRVLRVSALVVVLMIGTLPATQQDHVPNDFGDGRQLFIANCAACHGPDGDSVAGVDLGHGKFKRASSDDDLVQIIGAGIPGTSMPAFSKDLSELEIRAIISYFHYMAATAYSTSAPGDAVQGRAIFEGKGECLSCHRVKDKGSRLGPDLTEIGAVRRMVELERSLLEPDAEILPPNRFVRLVTRQGATITGRLLNQDTFTVQIIDSQERLLSLPKSSLKKYTFTEKSPMPSYQDRLNPGELADLVSYLVSLKGIDHQ